MIKGISSLKYDDSIISYTCTHPELVPTAWEQKKPEPCAMIIGCCGNNVTCPVCGYGWGQSPCCSETEIIHSGVVLDNSSDSSGGTPPISQNVLDYLESQTCPYNCNCMN